MKAESTTDNPGARRWYHRLVSACRRDNPMRDFWEPRFDELATYNAEVSRGIQHTQEKRQRMAKLQTEYNAKIESQPGVIVLR